MKDDAQGVPATGPNPADAVPQVDSIDTPGSPDRPLSDGEGHRISLSERDHFGAGLHPGTLFRHDELAARKVRSRPGQEHRELQREHMLTVNVLMQAVVVTGLILEQERGGPPLPGLMAPLKELVELRRVSDIDSHRLIPPICDRSKARV